jgi:hypothetical protein
LLGAALLTVGTVLHPAHADPGSPAAAFAEYAGVSRALGGLAAVNGVTLALSGFSAATMLATMVSGALALVWMLLAAVWSWRRTVIQHP